MAYALKSIYESFYKEATELNTIVARLANEPESLERDSHIEGCFIRLVVGWECFVEEYVLRCMCKAKTRGNYVIKPLNTAFKNPNEAFKKINKNRKDRLKDYTDWLDNNQVQHRIDDHFRQNSRVQKLCEAPDKLFELKVIRNAIAHRSPNAIAKFEKYVKEQMGYLASMKPTMASLLVQKKRANNKYIFSILCEYFLGLADRLTK